MRAYLLTCPSREAHLAATLAQLARSDWGLDAVTVIRDEPPPPASAPPLPTDPGENPLQCGHRFLLAGWIGSSPAS